MKTDKVQVLLQATLASAVLRVLTHLEKVPEHPKRGHSWSCVLKRCLVPLCSGFPTWKNHSSESGRPWLFDHNESTKDT